MEKLKIDVTEEGLRLLDNRPAHYVTSGYMKLSPKEAYELIGDIIRALADWHSLTGKSIDDPKCS